VSRLQEIDSDLEYVQSLHSYFKNENILMDTLHPHTFTHKERARYFNSVFANFPKKSLIFLDPDNGLEVSKPNQRHLLFNEMKMIHDLSIPARSC
jgi:phospholipid N-methyltransferase